MFLYLKTTQPEEDWVIWLIDYESAFLNADLDKDIYIEYPEEMVELGFLTKEEKEENCAKLGTSMYGNVDAALRWNRTLTEHMIEKMELKQSLADPCVIYNRDENDKLDLMMGINVDDTLAIGKRSKMEEFEKEISKRFNITCQKEVKKHLGVDYEWGEDKIGFYAKASMKNYEKDIVKAFEEADGKSIRTWKTPAYPGTTLVKGTHTEPYKAEAYRRIVGKIMFWNKKIGVECNNATRELSRFMKNPGKEHWKAL